MYLKPLFDIMQYRHDLLDFVNTLVQGKVDRRWIKKEYYTAGYRDGHYYITHLWREQKDNVESFFDDFEIIKLFNREPTEEEQQAYRMYMEKFCGPNSDYAEKCREFLDIKNDEDDNDSEL